MDATMSRTISLSVTPLTPAAACAAVEVVAFFLLLPHAAANSAKPAMAHISRKPGPREHLIVSLTLCSRA